MGSAREASPTQLRMANKYCIFLTGRLRDVEVDIAGVNTYNKFELIDIMGDKEPYPTLLGIKRAYKKYVIIELKKELMIFKEEGMWVIQPLDPYQGPRFTKPMDDRDKPRMLEQFYGLTVGKREDYINPTVGGSVSWRSIQSSKVILGAMWDAW